MEFLRFGFETTVQFKYYGALFRCTVGHRCAVLEVHERELVELLLLPGPCWTTRVLPPAG